MSKRSQEPTDQRRTELVEAQWFDAAASVIALETLDPNVLCAGAEAAIQALQEQGESTNTVRAYRTAIRYWEAWFALRYRRRFVLPVAITTVQQFVADHAERKHRDAATNRNVLVTEMPEELDRLLVAHGFKKAPGPLSLATLNLRMSALSKLHRIAEASNPCQHVRIRELMAKTRRSYVKRDVLPHKKDAITRDPLALMLATCDGSMIGLRDRALLHFGWSTGGRRRSEVTQATMENVRRRGPRQYTFQLTRSKTDQAGANSDKNAKPLTDEAADALTAWLAASKITEGAVFRRVRGKKVSEPLVPSAVRDIVIRRAKMAGLEGDFSAHSLRSGFVTEAAKQRLPLAETMAMTGHTSVQTVIGYFQVQAALESKGARLFGNDEPNADPRGL